MTRILLAVGLAVLLSGCAVADRWSGVSQAKQLHTSGQPARAEILRIWDTGMTVNNDPVVGFVLQVQPVGMPAYEAQTKLRISRIQLSQFQPGAVVPVRVDPADSTRVSLDIYDFSQ